MKKRGNQIIFIISDIVLSAAAIIAAVWLRFDGSLPDYYRALLPLYCGIAGVTVPLFGVLFGCYRSVYVSFDFSEAVRQGFACALSGGVFLIIKYAVNTQLVSGTITVIFCGFAFLLTVFARALPSLFNRRPAKGEIRAIIVGAGATGALTIRRLQADGAIRPVAVVDNDATKRGWYVEGVRIMGNFSAVGKIAMKTGATVAVIAIPSISAEAKQRIFNYCREAGLSTRMVGGALEVDSVHGSQPDRIDTVSYDNLMSKKGQTDFALDHDGVLNKNIVIFGSESAELRQLYKQLSDLSPASVSIVPEKTDLNDTEAVEKAMTGADVVYVFGTLTETVIAAAERLKPERLVLVEAEMLVSLQTRIYRTPAEISQEEIDRIEAVYNSKKPYLFFKRAFDIVASFFGIILLSPLLLVISLIILLGSKGPILFRQYRSGRNGREFIVLKFRSMYISAPAEMATRLLENPDSYITPIGRFLRKTSLDELPQIFNIFGGSMSVIGPRPLLASESAIAYRRKNGASLIRPGLTGLAQINGRDELTDEQKAAFDGVYFENMSLWNDIKIFFKTIGKVFRREGIKEGRAE